MFIGSSSQEVQDFIRTLAAKKLCVQPFILCVGNKDLKSFENFLVYLDGISFQFPTFLRAVDICFKCFHLFNLEYPPACIQFWQFIESYFYQIQSSSKISSKVYIMSQQVKETVIPTEK